MLNLVDLWHYIKKYFQFTSSLMELVRWIQTDSTIFLRTSALEYYWFSCVKYGIWINRTTYCNFSVPVFCICQIFSFCIGTGIVKKRYGSSLDLEIRELKKTDFKCKKANFDLDSLISCRKNSVFGKFLQFKVSIKQLRSSKAYISCPKRVFNQEVNNKKKTVKILQQRLIDLKNSLNC